MTFRTRFNPCKVSPPVGGETLTQSQFLHECDVNRMIQRFLMGDPQAIRHGRYGDFTSIPDSLHDACSRVAAASSIWENMPESIRASYGSPEALLSAVDAINSVQKPSVKEDDKPVEPKTEASNAEPVHTSLDI